MEWQPIETAPKNGADIIGMSKYGDIYRMAWDDGDDEYVSGWFNGDDEEMCPVLWAPLPEPPGSIMTFRTATTIIIASIAASAAVVAGALLAWAGVLG